MTNEDLQKAMYELTVLVMRWRLAEAHTFMSWPEDDGLYKKLRSLADGLAPREKVVSENP